MVDSTEPLILGFFIVSVIPIFPDPFHPEKYGGEPKKVMFWEWLAKEIWEVYSGVELRLKCGKR